MSTISAQTKSERTLQGIYAYIERHPLDDAAYEDAFSAVMNLAVERWRGGSEPSEDEEQSVRPAAVDLTLTAELKRTLRTGLGQARSHGDVRFMERADELQRRILCYEGPESFDSFMLYNEVNRPLDQQFWLPRRKKLLPVARALQDLEDGNQDELFLSMPPRVGKTTLMLFFVA